MSNKLTPARLPKMQFRVEVRYSGGLSSEKDKELFKAAGRYSDGSGCGFGGRDHEWEFPTKEAADLCAAKLRKVPDVTVTVHDES